MTKYYVYIVKTDDPNERINAFVEDPYAFAIRSFDPARMEFSGVYVEAESPESANRVYMHPQIDDVFVSCDEPRATVLKRRAYESHIQVQLNEMKNSLTRVEQDINRLRINTLIVEIAGIFAQMAIKISELSRLVRTVVPESEKNKFSSEEIYERLVRQYGEQLTQLKYRPSGSDE